MMISCKVCDYRTNLRLTVVEARLSETGIVSAEVDLDDMAYDESARAFSYPCRCGDAYVVTEDQLQEGCDELQCGSCSFRIRVSYIMTDGPE